MSKPNVLLFYVDQWTAKMLGCMGNRYVSSPTIDQLAANGILFNQAYSATPTCIPARRGLMTGTCAKTHGDRVFNEHLEMDPDLPTMPQVFRDAGYQAYAVGKLHVYPQRDRIGFDDVILNEEGRHHLGGRKDDFELFLEHEGYSGQELTHAMGNNEYTCRPWHLPEYCHPTNWTTREMCRTILRRDPKRPAFWFCSYITPHPPVTPPKEYLDMYKDRDVDDPFIGEWAENFDDMPLSGKLQSRRLSGGMMNEVEIREVRRAFYAQCTYIDHQMRLVIGTLREEGLLDNTIIMLTADHGDMLGNHRMWAKSVMYEYSNKIPMILMSTAGCERVGHHKVDDRLVELCDVMPTLLDLCNIPIPDTVEGHSLVSDYRREYLYGEHYDNDRATRMIRADQYKLIWYSVGNRFQLFDLDNDPCEMKDLSKDKSLSDVMDRLKKLLLDNLYGEDLAWIEDGQIVGLPDMEFGEAPNRGLSGQRGWRS